MSNKNVLFSSAEGKKVFSVDLVGDNHQRAQEYILYEETDKTWLWNWADRTGKPYRTHKGSSTNTKVFHSAKEANEAVLAHILVRIEEKERALMAAMADLGNFLDTRRTYYSDRYGPNEDLETSRIDVAIAEQRRDQESGHE